VGKIRFPQVGIIEFLLTLERRGGDCHWHESAALMRRLYQALDQFDRAVVVAVIAVRMVQVAIDEIIDVVPMRHGFVTARRAVNVARLMAATVVIRSALVGIFRIDRERMLVDVIAVHVMQMAVVQIVDMIVVLDRRMPTVRAVLMVVIGVMRFAAGGAHAVLLIHRWLPAATELAILTLLNDSRLPTDASCG
jgi:hypothetical protein